MSERSIEHAWKACVRFTPYREFESPRLRAQHTYLRWQPVSVAMVCEVAKNDEATIWRVIREGNPGPPRKRIAPETVWVSTTLLSAMWLVNRHRPIG